MDESLLKLQAIRMLKSMLRIRRFEERVIRLVNDNEIAGVTHEYIGQEAVAVGVCEALRLKDMITSTHRGHGHILAKGGQPSKMMAELFARSTGYNKGRGGSMHIADLSLNIYGANGIVAAGAPIAMGAAWTQLIKSTSEVAVTFFGDGAMNQGVLHETMNMASLWKIPMIFVCENNGYAVTFSADEASANPNFAERAAAYRMPSQLVDGMNALEVFKAAQAAVERARNGEGPTFLECKTYRYMGHHTAEATMGITYRTKEEIEQWKLKDPIQHFISHMEQAYSWSTLDQEQLESEMIREIEDAVEYARTSPNPNPEDSLLNMYSTPYEGIPAKGWI